MFLKCLTQMLFLQELSSWSTYVSSFTSSSSTRSTRIHFTKTWKNALFQMAMFPEKVSTRCLTTFAKPECAQTTILTPDIATTVQMQILSCSLCWPMNPTFLSSVKNISLRKTKVEVFSVLSCRWPIISNSYIYRCLGNISSWSIDTFLAN